MHKTFTVSGWIFAQSFFFLSSQQSQFQVRYFHKASSSLVHNNQIFRSRQWNHVLAHYTGKSTTQKVPRASLWWPPLHRDDKDYYRAYDVCQRVGKPSRRDDIPLAPQLTLQAWAIDFVGHINPPGKHTGERYIIIVTEYLTRWVKARAIKECSETTVVHFIFDDNIIRFVCPKILMSDQGTHFINKTVETLTEEFVVHHQKSTPYHPKANGIV
jgi:transposase InsO family protein